MGARYFIDGQVIVAPRASRLRMIAGVSQTLTARLAANDVACELVTANTDGSTTIEGRDRSGTLEFRETSTTTTTTSGANTTASTTVTVATKYDDDGNGTYERSQTIATTNAADGSSTRLIRNFDVSGALVNTTQIVTAADIATSTARSVTTSLDQNGDGLFDEVQARDAAGNSQTFTTKLAANGAEIYEIVLGNYNVSIAEAA